MGVSGCSHVEIKDSEWCGDLGDDGAICFHTLTSDTRDIQKSYWDTERIGMVCTQSDIFAEWKAVIEKLCDKAKACDYQSRTVIEYFFKRVIALEANKSQRI
jgi:hypothetical protein